MIMFDGRIMMMFDDGSDDDASMMGSLMMMFEGGVQYSIFNAHGRRSTRESDRGTM